MKKKDRRLTRAAIARAVRTIDIPVPAGPMPLEELLASKLGSEAAATKALAEVEGEFGLGGGGAPRSVSAALVLTRLGTDLDQVARSLAWDEFEHYCAMTISAAGYAVTKNVRLRKPTRQIDIVAESSSLVLAVDCKHWRRSAGSADLEKVALAQAERTKMYARGTLIGLGRTCLPMLLTMVDNPVKVVGGVPVVPLQALREFLASVTRFDERFSFVGPE